MSKSPSQPPYRTLLLDMDGVLAEVSKSYRASILETCHKYGATSVTLDVIGDWKAPDTTVNDLAITLQINAEAVQQGNSSAILGNPLESLAEITRILSSRGIKLEPGQSFEELQIKHILGQKQLPVGWPFTFYKK